MSILARFTPTKLTTEMYREVNRRLEEAGLWPHPDGLEVHVCFGGDPTLLVSEIWSSQEQMEAFAQRLMPVLSEVGVEFTHQPEILPVENVVANRTRATAS